MRYGRSTNQCEAPSMGPGLRRTSQRILHGLVAVMTVAAGSVGAQVLAALAEAAAPCPTEAGVESDALAIAARCGHRVAITGRTTETSLTFANPDGTLNARISPMPIRVRRGAGWVPVSTTLITNPDGSVSPVAAAEELHLSGGGSGPLLSLGAAGQRMTLHWPLGALPRPTLSGDTATYADVLPGVDLQLVAGVEGFRQLLVVHTPEAAANPALARVSFGLALDGLRMQTRPDGVIEAVNGAGVVVYSSPGAFMWDSPTAGPVGLAGDQVTNDAGAEPSPHRVEEMAVQLTATELAIVPVHEMLHGEDTLFPLYLDPSFLKDGTWWLNVNKGNPDHTYYGEQTLMHTGLEWNTTTQVWRSHMRFIISELAGSTITEASLHVTADHTARCTGSAPIQLWQTTYTPTPGSYTWDTTSKNDWDVFLDTESFSANESSCPKPDDPGEFTGNLQSRLQTLANGTPGSFVIGLRAQTETNDFDYTLFHPSQTELDVTYGKKPLAPVAQPILSSCYLACSSPAVVRTTQPTLRVRVSDANGGPLDTHFEVRSAPSDTATLVTSTAAPVSTAISGGPPPFGIAQWQVPSGKLINGTTYYWRAQSTDELDLLGPWMGWQTLTVDTAPPVLPSVSSTQYPFKQWGAVVNTQGTFSFSASGAHDFTWSVDAGSSSTTTATSVTHTPTTDLVHTLHVTAKDIAGNTSAPFDHQFWVSSVPARCWYWKMDETSGSTAADSGKAECSPTDPSVTAVLGAVTGTFSFAPAHIDYGLFFTGAGGQVSMGQATVDTNKSFSVTAWVNPSDLTLGDQTVISQDGTNTSRFQLYYDADANGGAGGWCFGMRATDTSGAPVSVCATGTLPESESVPPTEDVWVHLAGVHVYDPVTGTGQIQIHVMGNPSSCSGEKVEAPFAGTWTTTGSLVIGRAKSGASNVEAWRGGLDDVRAYPIALTLAKICQLASM